MTPWDERVAAVWAGAGDRHEDDVVADIEALVAERPAGDAAARFELASARDFAGREAEAEPLYRAALGGGLDAERRPQALIQLASTLRNLGRPDDALAVLDGAGEPDTLETTAFRSLALADAGRAREAVRLLLESVAPQLPRYSRAVRYYAGALGAVALRAVADDGALDDVVAAAVAGAEPDDVTPPLGDGWCETRLEWLRTYHRERFEGLAGPAGEVTLAVREGGRTCGVVRLRALGHGRHETGLWLTRDVRGRGVGRAVFTDVLALAGTLGAREVVAETTTGNPAAQALLRGAGFTLSVDGTRVSAVRR